MKKTKFSRNKKLPENRNLPPELLKEVLARLPSKTLLKIRCVCKTWCSLIDSFDFINFQRKLYNNNNNNMNNNCGYTRLLVLVPYGGKYKLSVRRSDTFKQIGEKFGIIKFGIPSVDIHQICNGVLLGQTYGGSVRTILLWNPSINKSLVLPHLPTQYFKFALYFLGFAPSTNDYKVLAHRAYEEGDIAVYSLNDHRWRVKNNELSVEDSGLSWLADFLTRIVYSGGVIYWAGCGYKYRLGEKVDQWTHLFCFDFDVEEFRFVLLPDAVKGSLVWFIFAFHESIAVFTMSSENSCIWAMEKDGEEDPCWRLWFSGEPNLDACKILKSIPNDYSSHSRILYEEKSTSFLISYSLPSRSPSIRVGLTSYNLMSNKIQYFRKSTQGMIYFDTYVDSLVLHKGVEGQTLTSLEDDSSSEAEDESCG